MDDGMDIMDLRKGVEETSKKRGSNSYLDHNNFKKGNNNCCNNGPYNIMLVDKTMSMVVIMIISMPSRESDSEEERQ